VTTPAPGAGDVVEAGAVPVTGTAPRPQVREPVAVQEVLGISLATCRSRWSALSPSVAHGIARLRVDVLVVEAGRPQAELDDLDLDAATEHLWVPDGDLPVAYLRLVRGADDVAQVDRVCARHDVRRLGLVGQLVAEVVARRGAAPLRALVPQDAVATFLRQTFEVAGPPTASAAGALVPLLRHPEAPWRY